MDRMRMETPDLTETNVEKIGMLFPNCITEAIDKNGQLKKAINFDLLRQMLSEDVLEGDEAYEFTWVGKKAAIVEANKPIRKTLRPCPEESVDWDTTENLYIEGDNLEVLKLLQESYLGKINIIYIDPPYNTGHDFVYPDSFAMREEEFDDGIGYYDEDGNINYSRENSSSYGRYHSAWCSMIYSRLMLARNLLSDDGLIFISIDNNEIENLRKICDEVFGQSNCVSQMVWKNKYGAGGGTNGVAYVHEYILVYSKSVVTSLTCELNEELISSYNKRDEKYATRGGYLTQPLASTSKGARVNLMYTIVHNGELISPPKGGRWIWSKEKFDIAYKNNEIVINKNANGYSVRFKQYLKDENGVMRRGTQLSMITNVFNQEGTKEFAELMGDKRIFDFPKPIDLLKQLFKFEINGKNGRNAYILDFFSGSGSSAHAVMSLNAEDGGKRKFIMIQIPEVCAPDSVAFRNGYKTISEIGKERIRRAGDKIKKEGLLTTQNLDAGFRVFKLDDSNMNDVYYSAGEYTQNLLTMLESNVKPDRTDLDLLFGCLLEWGLPLSMPYKSEKIGGCIIHTYNDGDLIACFDENIPDTVIKEIAHRQPLRAVFRDSSFNDSPAKINVREIFKMLAPDTRIKVI